MNERIYCGDCEYFINRKDGGKNDEYGDCFLTGTSSVYDHFECLYNKEQWMLKIIELQAENARLREQLGQSVGVVEVAMTDMKKSVKVLGSGLESMSEAVLIAIGALKKHNDKETLALIEAKVSNIVPPDIL